MTQLDLQREIIETFVAVIHIKVSCDDHADHAIIIFVYELSAFFIHRLMN